MCLLFLKTVWLGLLLKEFRGAMFLKILAVKRGPSELHLLVAILLYSAVGRANSARQAGKYAFVTNP